MAVRDGRGDVKQTTTGFRDPRHHICQKQIPIPQLLNDGTHPYQGILKQPQENANTNDEKAAAGLYPHGIEAHPKILPRPQSVHHLWDDKTRRLFDKAFIMSSSNVRPTAQQWTDHFKILIDKKVLTGCVKVPRDVDHMRFEGKDCPTCYRAALKVSKPKVRNRKIRHTDTDSAGKIMHPPRASTWTGNKSSQSSKADDSVNAWLFAGLFFLVVFLIAVFYA